MPVSAEQRRWRRYWDRHSCGYAVLGKPGRGRWNYRAVSRRQAGEAPAEH
jgi:hypothetical protein